MSLSSQIKVPAQVKGAVGGGSGGGATSLDGLSDVAITSAASGDFLRNNGTNFVNTPLSANDMPTGIDAAKIGGGAVSNTEFGYLDGVTSAIQTQLDAKASSSSLTSGLAGKQASITGTPTGTKFARDTGAWDAIAEADLPAATIIHPLTSVTGVNAIGATCAVTPAAGMFFRLVPASTSTLNPTININGAGAVNLKRSNGTDNAAPGETVSGRPQILYYDGTVYRIVTGQTSSLEAPFTTGGTSTAYTLTDTRVGTPVNDQVFAFIPHIPSGLNPTLAVNGGSAINLRSLDNSGALQGVQANQLSTNAVVGVRYISASSAYVVEYGLVPIAGNIPNTLSATTFSGAVTVSAANLQFSGTGVLPSSSVAYITKDNGSQMLYNAATSAAHVMTINGTERFRADGSKCISAGNLGVTGGQIWPNGAGALQLLGGTTTSNGAALSLNASSNDSGCLDITTALTTRSNSTSVDFIGYSSTTVRKFIIIDSQGKKAEGMFYGTGPTITLDSGSDADYVTTSPTSGQIQVTTNGSNKFRLTLGSAATRGINVIFLGGV